MVVLLLLLIVVVVMSPFATAQQQQQEEDDDIMCESIQAATSNDADACVDCLSATSSNNNNKKNKKNKNCGYSPKLGCKSNGCDLVSADIPCYSQQNYIGKSPQEICNDIVTLNTITINTGNSQEIQNDNNNNNDENNNEDLMLLVGGSEETATTTMGGTATLEPECTALQTSNNSNNNNSTTTTTTITCETCLNAGCAYVVDEGICVSNCRFVESYQTCWEMRGGMIPPPQDDDNNNNNNNNNNTSNTNTNTNTNESSTAATTTTNIAGSAKEVCFNYYSLEEMNAQLCNSKWYQKINSIS